MALCTAHFLSMLMLQPDLQLFQLICKVPTLLRLALLGAEAAAAQPRVSARLGERCIQLRQGRNMTLNGQHNSATRPNSHNGFV